MSFLGDLFSNAWQGLTGSAEAGGRGLDDLAHGDTNSFTNEGENSFRDLSRIPGTSASTLRGLYLGANGDLDWNPYSVNNSVFDQAAGGGASEDPRNRAIGRMIGTAAGGYFTGAGLSSAGMGSSGGAAASGALWGAGQAAGQGGDRNEIFQGAMKGGGGALAGSYLSNLDLADSAGITDPRYKGIVNGAVGGAAGTAIIPGADSKDIARGGVIGGISGGLRNTNFGGGNMDDLPGSFTARDANGELIPSQNTTNGFIPVAYGGAPSTTKQASDNPFGDYIDKALGFFKQGDGSWNGQRIDQTINGLMGLYGGYQRKRAADQFMRGMSGRRNAYEQNMRGELMRRDAASGRRSNYDTRAVDLNAKLAALDAQQAPALMQAQNSSLAGMFNMLSSGYGMARGYGAFGSKPNQQDPSLGSDNVSGGTYKNYSLQEPMMAELPYGPPEYTPNPESPYTLAGGYNALRRRGYNGGF